MMTASSYTTGPSFQPLFTELPHTELPSQAPHAPDHAPWMYVSVQISPLGLVSQHEEMMAYLRSVFPPPPPQP
ncbi:hypothetical protein CK203_022784 [Vitis vinifera]|uniref:Uncharacterized protein n=1 Tax=Vitis vinifera TaxID=29760 RepID=A0A438IWI3_VITVI|nr:hypothetical protein CK203_022784 [Vitis vinifera]